MLEALGVRGKGGVERSLSRGAHHLDPAEEDLRRGEQREAGVVTTELLQSLIERGLRVDRPILLVIDGGKGIRKALTDVFGNRAVVQRCQVHKTRNVLDHLPDERRSYVRRQMREAYKSKSTKTAKAATWTAD